METKERSGQRLIIFDGVCNLCSAAVRGVIQHDRRGVFRFASLQSEAGRAALAAASAPLDLPDSIVLVDEAGFHTRSDAAIRIARHLRLPFSLLIVTRLVPRRIRDTVYSWIARNRYGWFGRRETCLMPTPELLDRFLDADEPRTLVPASSASPHGSILQSSAAPAPSTHARQSRMRLVSQFLFRTVLAYFFIYIFCFPVGWIPGTVWLFDQYLELRKVVTTAVAHVVFSYEITIFPALSGDTTYNYVEVFTFAMLAILGALGWSLIRRGKPVSPRTRDLMRTYVRYCLGAFLLSYGWQKLFPLQFGVLGPERLKMPIGEASPMGLLWTFMAASPAYTMCVGFSEVLGGFLLLWRRTALAGALVTLGVMVNVVALNFSYDVPVKLFSVHLLLMAVFIIAPDAMRLLSVLLLNLPAQPCVLRPFPINRKWLRRTLLVFKLAFVFLVGVFPAYTSYETLKTYGWLMPRKPFPGVYRVDSFTHDGASGSAVSDDVRWIRVGIDQNWVCAIQRANGETQRYRLKVDTENRTFTISRRGVLEPTTLKYSEPKPGFLRLEGELEEGSIVASLRKQPEDASVLMSRGFHWINEVPFHR